MFNRDSAFSMEVRDPENADDESPIVQMLTIGEELILFKENSIHKGLTADTIDPERSNPDTRHSHEFLYDIGAANSFVARMILQFYPMIGLCTPQKTEKEILVQKVWDANKLLLECEKAYFHIYKNTMDLMPKCDAIVEAHKTKPAIPALPKVPDLKTHVADFHINGKKLLVSAYKLIHHFYGLPMDGRNEAHFDKHKLWIKEKLGESHPIYKLVNSDESWIRLISECSNAVRHEESGLKLEVKNFALNPGNKISTPTWRHDLSKKGLEKQEHYTDIIYDMNVRIYNMFTFFEEMLLICLKEKLKNNKMLDIFRKTKENINPKCPVAYEVNLKN